MAYKTSFKPLEKLSRDGWRRMGEGNSDAPSEPLSLPVRPERRRLLINA
jgi:hypothetical protein